MFQIIRPKTKERLDNEKQNSNYERSLKTDDGDLNVKPTVSLIALWKE